MRATCSLYDSSKPFASWPVVVIAGGARKIIQRVSGLVMSKGKRGRPQLGENELSKDQRRVRIKQMDWAELDECLQFITDDPSTSCKDPKGNLCSKSASLVFRLFVQMAQEKNAALKKKAKTAGPTPGELAKDPYFQHAVARCGVNAYEEPRNATRKNWVLVC